MSKPPLWFYVVAAVALAWNLVGLMAVVADLRLSAADLAALPAAKQAMYAARPAWSVAGSLLAVVGGALGCALLLWRHRFAVAVLALSIAGIVVQDIGIFLLASAASGDDPAPLVLQGLVLVIGAGLLLLARRAQARAWLTR